MQTTQRRMTSRNDVRECPIRDAAAIDAAAADVCDITHAACRDNQGFKAHNPACQDTYRRLSRLCHDTALLGRGSKQVEQCT